MCKGYKAATAKRSASNQEGSLSGTLSAPRWVPSSCSGLCPGIRWDKGTSQWSHSLLATLCHQLHGVDGRLATAWWTRAHNSVWASEEDGVNQGGLVAFPLLSPPKTLALPSLPLYSWYAPSCSRKATAKMEISAMHVLNSLHSLLIVWTSLYYMCAYIHTYIHIHIYTYI